MRKTGLAPLVGRRAGTDQVHTWTRARSASEGLKTEVYSYLAGGSAYVGQDTDHELGVRSRRIVDAVGDLLRTTVGVQPAEKPIPGVYERRLLRRRARDPADRTLRPAEGPALRTRRLPVPQVRGGARRLRRGARCRRRQLRGGRLENQSWMTQ